ncbi:MAG: glycosyltransferase family 2 protein [Lachnospiraceae bacterium]|jgi:glucosyltransferase|nr:glycosyltransferase family 2 protein [Lachnospiraceae bacterium]
MEGKKKTIDIVIPCSNEQECVRLIHDRVQSVFCSRLTGYEWRILFIDDGSSDNTLEEIRKLAGSDPAHVFYISFTRHFGKEAAVYAGLEHSTGEYTAVMDCDLQHPPEMLAEMAEALEKEDYDCAAAQRTQKIGRPSIQRFISDVYYHMINWVTGLNFVPGMTDYRLMKRRVVESVLELQERERFLKGIYAWVGFRTKWIAYENVERAAGKSSWSFKGLWNYAKSGFMAYATTPLRGVVWLGMVGVAVSVVYGITVLVDSLSGLRAWQDTTTIILLLLFFGSVIVTILGIIGEYLARIYMEVKKRPIYIGKETNIGK